MKLTREEMEKIISSIQAGEEYLIEMDSISDYNSQRVMFYRAIARMRAVDSSLPLDIAHSKVVDDKIFLRIYRPSPRVPKLMKVVDGEVVETTIPNNAKTHAEILQEKEFESWLSQVKTANSNGEIK